jgi:amino acid transporter
VIVGVAQFFCGMSSVTANSRMIYAFSRDGALPGSKFWHHVSKKRRVPVRSAWFGAVGAFIISIPYMWNYAAYNSIVGTAVIGLYIAYLTPVFLRRINPKAWVPGPYKLAQPWGAIIGWIAIVWVIFICIVLLLPATSPVTSANFNYSFITVGGVIGFAFIWWIAGARKWFKGPKIQGTPEELAEIERDLSI